MLVIISPAKKLNWDPVSLTNLTNPAFQKEAVELVDIAKNLSPKKLSQYSEVSILLNYECFPYLK